MRGFSYGAATILPLADGWQTAAARSFALLDRPKLSAVDPATFVDDYLFQLLEVSADLDLIFHVAEAPLRTARAPDVRPIDRALSLNRVAGVMAHNGDPEAALTLAERALAQLGGGYAGNQARNSLGIRIICLWFQPGKVEQSIDFAQTLLDEIAATSTPNWVDVNRLQVLLGAAFSHLGHTSEVQVAYPARLVALWSGKGAVGARSARDSARHDGHRRGAARKPRPSPRCDDMPADTRSDDRVNITTTLLWQPADSGRFDEALVLDEAQVGDTADLRALRPDIQIEVLRMRATLF